jgi:hypothetical protein
MGAHTLSLALGVVLAIPLLASAQAPTEGEVRQLVSFTLLPGRAADALTLYRERAVPLYREDEHLISFRAFREAESPVPVDLVIVRAFDGLAGMDRSGERLREVASAQGTSIGALYQEIAALSTGHTDEFVEMLPELGGGDPSASRLSVFVRLRLSPHNRVEAEAAVRAVAAWERDEGIPVSTGRFLIADGWDYLRVLGFESLGGFQTYLERVREAPGHPALDALVVERRIMVLPAVRGLALR